MKNKQRIAFFVFIASVHILMISAYGNIFKYSYNGIFFVKDFNTLKYCFSVFESIIIFISVCKKSDSSRLTENAFVLLDLLYFIPGSVQQAVTNSKFEYMLFYFSFWIGIQLWLRIVKPRDTSSLSMLVKTKHPKTYIYVIISFSFISIVLIGLYSGHVFSLNNVVSTLNDVYEVRAAYKENSLHWLIANIEQFSAYCLMLVIAYSALNHKWVMIIFCFLAELTTFLIQGSRVILFLSFIALMIGLIKFDTTKVGYVFFAASIVLVAEACFTTKGWICTDIFRRYSLVPNRLSEQYFEYFSSHSADLLRSVYVRIASLIGEQSEYSQPSIGVIIGQIYYDTNMNCNTGLVGGGIFMFGRMSPIITTFGYVMSFRLFESITAKSMDKSIIMFFAMLLATLAINMGTMLTCFFRITEILFLYISLIPISSYDLNKITRQ